MPKGAGNRGIFMRKTQVITHLDEKMVKELEKTRDETGLPISRLIDLKLKGYKIVKIDPEEHV